MALRNQIREIALEFPGYGYRRITAELQNRGYAVNHKRVLRLMRQDNLLCLKRKFKPVTTDSSHGLPVYPNPVKEHQDHWTESGLGFGYHIRSVAA
jgi:transposase InsO family protein